MEFSFELANRAMCTLEEKLSCYDIIFNIRCLLDKARNNGILSIEKDIYEISSETLSGFLLQRGLMYVVDGVSIDLIEENLKTFLFAELPFGEELLRCLIVIKGVTYMHKGMNPNTLTEMLLPFLGMEACKKLTKRLKRDINKDVFDSYFNEASNFDESADSIIDFIADMKDESIQRILLDIDDRIIARAVKSSSKRVNEVFLLNVSSFRIVNIFDELKNIRFILNSEKMEAQKLIANVVQQLVDEGKIVLKE